MLKTSIIQLLLCMSTYVYVVKYIFLDVFPWAATNDREIPHTCLLLSKVDFTVL